MRLCWYYSKLEAWIRVGRYVFVWKHRDMQPGFLERFGHVRTLLRIRGYRLVLEVEGK